MPRLVLATRNDGKLREVRRLLRDLDLEVVDLGAYPHAPVVSEESSTFMENACAKARALARYTGECALADDSGIEVDALRGAPSVRSARYAGVHGDDRANTAKLLGDLACVPPARRGARFVCALALAWPDGKILTAEGVCAGLICSKPRGERGFGYDPVFFLPELGCTMAELSDEEKDRLSHRGRALANLRSAIAAHLRRYAPGGG